MDGSPTERGRRIHCQLCRVMNLNVVQDSKRRVEASEKIVVWVKVYFQELTTLVPRCCRRAMPHIGVYLNMKKKCGAESGVEIFDKFNELQSVCLPRPGVTFWENTNHIEHYFLRSFRYKEKVTEAKVLREWIRTRLLVSFCKPFLIA